MTEQSHNKIAEGLIDLPTFTGTEVGYYFICPKK
jgi:hypothetical protein